MYSSSRQNPNRLHSRDHPWKETPDQYRQRKATMAAAAAESAERHQKREAERAQRRFQLDCVGSSPFQRQVWAERKAQQDMRRDDTFPTYAYNEPGPTGEEQHD